MVTVAARLEHAVYVPILMSQLCESPRQISTLAVISKRAYAKQVKLGFEQLEQRSLNDRMYSTLQSPDLVLLDAFDLASSTCY
jgi:hypothetical protein